MSLQKVELEGNGEARRELLPGLGAEGAQEGRVLHSGAGDWLKERWDGGKGGKRGWRKVKGTPEEERGSFPWVGREEEEEDGGSPAKLEGGKENWDIMDETPEVRIWDRSSLSHGWAAGQGARTGVRAQGGAGKEHPSSNQRGLGCPGLLQGALSLPIVGHFNAPSSLRKGPPDIPAPAPGMGHAPGHPSCFAWMLQLKKKRNGIKFPSNRRNCRFVLLPG